jgi:hypothetical protein
MSERPEPWIWHFLKTMPSTNVRIAASILAMLGMWFVVLVTATVASIWGRGKGWEPSEILLGFLVIWAGLDLGQFMGKRTTDAAYVAAKQSGEPPKDPPSEPKPPEIGA